MVRISEKLPLFVVLYPKSSKKLKYRLAEQYQPNYLQTYSVILANSKIIELKPRDTYISFPIRSSDQQLDKNLALYKFRLKNQRVVNHFPMEVRPPIMPRHIIVHIRRNLYIY